MFSAKKNTSDNILKQLDKIEIPISIRENLPQFFNQQNTKFVLSLAGGGAKGVVGNVALIFLLEKLGLINNFEEIWGVSAGSIVGGFYSTGLSLEQLIKFVVEARSHDYISLNLGKALERKSIEKSGLFSTNKIYNMFKAELPTQNFEDCNYNLYILATEVNGDHDKIHLFHEGYLADAMTASLSVPDVFEAREISGKKYVDGGLIENTPSVSVVKHHNEQADTRKLAIFSTCFGEANFKPGSKFLGGKLLNLLSVYRYQLQLAQLDHVRSNPNATQIMVNLDIGISKTNFTGMHREIVDSYKNLLEKLEKVCEVNDWNKTY